MSDAAPLMLFNSLTRQLEEFRPVHPGEARVYSCGPTVYNYQHIGNMRAYVFADTLGRVLRFKGYKLRHIINITDVGHLTSDADAGDDKMEKAAALQGKTAWDIAAFYTAEFKRDLKWLNVTDPAKWTVATDYVPAMIDYARSIADKHCYELDSGLYFDVSTVPEYGRLARAATDEGEGRIEQIEGKRHPADFAIWRKTPPGETRQMEWDSPWGRGAPGWHLECSVMSEAELGMPFDIHTGGIDHVRVHHTNEVAQTECALDVHPWVSVWMHNEFLDIGGEKISKSKGHVLLVDTLVEEGISPLAFRYFFLQAHYRQQQAFTLDLVRSADTALRRLVHHAVVARDALDGDVSSADAARTAGLRSAFWDALADDLNAPRALAVVSSVAREPGLTAADRWSLYVDFDRALGFGLADAVDPEGADTVDVADVPADLVELLERRQAARSDKDFATADRLRDEIVERGFDIVDTAEGPTLRRR